MTDRIIDISEGPVSIRIRNHLLVIRKDNTEVASIPVSEIAVLVLATPAITLTHAVLGTLASNGAIVVCSSNKRLPSGMLLPLHNNSIQAERFRQQAQASRPLCKRLWQQLIIAKIRTQAEALQRLYGSDFGLLDMAGHVKSGDVDNREALAAARYWDRMECIENRDRDEPDANRFLNYGYAVLMAMVARAICASGLHPGLGLHHHNRYNPFCLACDLMEPFRPIVDMTVTNLVRGRASEPMELDRNVKAELIRPLMGNVMLNRRRVKLFYALTRLTASLAAAFAGQANKLLIPEKILLHG